MPHTSPTSELAHQHSLADMLRRTAKRFPHKLAVVSGDKRLTYGDLDAAVSRTAAAL